MTDKKMNIFQKMAEARIQLQDSGMKKSGENKFSKYSYFELSDFLPKINQINKDLGLLAVFSSTEDQYTLSVHDAEDTKAEPIVFACPMASASLKGMHEIQNLGAVITYTRRYLYMNSYEIVENDPIDAGRKPDGKKTTRQANGEAGQKATNAIKGSNPSGGRYTAEQITPPDRDWETRV